MLCRLRMLFGSLLGAAVLLLSVTEAQAQPNNPCAHDMPIDPELVHHYDCNIWNPESLGITVEYCTQALGGHWVHGRCIARTGIETEEDCHRLGYNADWAPIMCQELIDVYTSRSC